MIQSDILDRAPRRTSILRQVAEVSDAFYPAAQGMAGQMGRDVSTSQIRNLEVLANSTRNVTHVLDLVKTQTGRGHLPRRAGEDLLNALTEMREVARRIATGVGDEGLTRQVHLELCREYLRHLSAHFDYQSAGRASRGRSR
jgi:hypothetical protein